MHRGLALLRWTRLMTKPIAQYRAALRQGGERPLIGGVTYAAVLHQLDAPRSYARPRGVLQRWRNDVDAHTPTESVMVAHIVEPGYVKLGWRHKPEPKRPLQWRLSRRTIYMVRWAERVHWPYAHLVAVERERARQRQAETEALDIALRLLKRAIGERKRLKGVVRTRTKSQDAARKRAERAAMRMRIVAIDEQRSMRAGMTASAVANGTLTND